MQGLAIYPPETNTRKMFGIKPLWPSVTLGAIKT